MKKALALAIALTFAISGVALGAKPSNTATLLVKTVVFDDPSALVDDHGRIDFQTETYHGKDRILVWLCYADWMPAGLYPNEPLLDKVSESATPTIPNKTGSISIYFRNGINPTSGTPYCQYWKAWVAMKVDWKTPISNIIEESIQ